ncbi:MAG: DHH family phosphoesterase [Patescibacteria group bacterium]
MALTPQQQAQEMISRAKHILVIGRVHPSIDTVAAAVGFGLYAKAMGKQADVVIQDFDAAKHVPSFLKDASMIRPNVGALRALHVKLDVSKTPIDELSYDVRDGVLDITVIPKEREWNPNDLTTKPGEDRYDVIVALDTPDMRSLGKIASEHADFLYRTHIINIDSHSTNENWGQVNIVNMNAVSTTEVLFELMNGWNAGIIDDKISTALLAGMMSNTRGFRTPNVTPRTLTASSHLIAMGAKRAEIVDGLWRTRSVSTLKLWGRALSRLHLEEGHNIVWTALSQRDFMESGAGAECLPDIIDELISTMPEAKMSVIIYENEKERDSICALISTAPPHHAANIGRPLGAVGSSERATVCIEHTTIAEAAKSIIELLKKSLKP